ncbi:glutamate decarboxylase 1-like [Biomphalaria glabrata]|uniref:Glutamate decarboxylase 1-like n=3 Tax=Biomphalaria TaxID=6525 RepID=A0A9W2YE29_BIOGL|nr:glutamate decarboxylase 1-like [Biomphalaria glabrata]
MFFNCGVFQKTKSGRDNKSEGSVTMSPTSQKRSLLNSKDGSMKEMSSQECLIEKKSHLCTNNWAQLEGVFYKDFSGENGPEKMYHFLQCLSEMLTSYIISESDRSAKVLDFHHPHQLKEMMSHCLDVHSEPRDLEQVLSDVRETLKYCVKTGHPHFLNQLSTGIDVVGVAGAWTASAANTNLFTYEAAPVFTLMEEVILTRMKHFIGWKDGEAIFAPGGAISNLYGVLSARHYAMPEVKTEGIGHGANPVIFTSEQSHFSIKRAAAILGIGTNNVIFVRCLANGKMDVEDLRERMSQSLREGRKIIMVNATCGTTVLGAFDPVAEIADLCEDHHVWLHVDAAWGGGALLSRDHKYLLEGIERADSVTWNPHKMMGVPLQCSAFLTKHMGLLKSCNGMGASYLFQKDKHYDISYDTGDMSIQCGRHNDIFKLWLMWRSKGDLGFEEQINRNFLLATYLRDQIKKREGFYLVVEQIEAPNVCFWYLPPYWRTCSFQVIPKEQVAKIAPLIKSKMMEAGSLMVQYQPLGDWPNLFRVAISNPVLTRRDIDFLLDEIDHLGQEINVPENWTLDAK